MSLMHSIIFCAINRGKRTYDPSRPFDYAAKRESQDRITPQRLPGGVKVKLFNGPEINGEYLYSENNPSETTVFYIHGGGFVVGSTKTVRPITGGMVKWLGLNVLSINYRLAPEFPYPAAHEDCMSAYRWLLEQPFGKRIVIMGESAGGNLVLGTVLHARDEGLRLPECAVTLAPTVQYDQVFPSYTENLKTDCMVSNLSEETRDVYLCSHDPEKLHDPYFAPYYGDYSGFPPTMIVASDSEVLRDDAVKLDEKLKTAGVKSRLVMYHKLMHTFPLIPSIPESRKAYFRITEFVRENMNGENS